MEKRQPFQIGFGVLFAAIAAGLLAPAQSGQGKSVLAEIEALARAQRVDAKAVLAEYGRIRDAVKPVKVKAYTTFNEDYSAGDVKNILKTELTLTFWNVGALVPGYEEATMETVTTSSLTKQKSRGSRSGFFTGGPRGQVWIVIEGVRQRLSLQNGAQVRIGRELDPESGPGSIIPVTNPEAFADWPENASLLKKISDAIKKKASLLRFGINLDWWYRRK